MLQIDKALVSLDVLEKKFVCELSACKGKCCVEGDSGAPLEDEETKIIEEIFPVIIKYMTLQGLKAVKRQGKWIIDSDGDKVTPLVKNSECAYTYKGKDKIVYCAIEKAFIEKEIDFQKPLSCHLYPIRITKYKDFEAVNYERNRLCIPARINGEKLGVELFRYVKAPLIRKYGNEWYKQLEVAAEEFQKSK